MESVNSISWSTAENSAQTSENVNPKNDKESLLLGDSMNFNI